MNPLTNTRNITALSDRELKYNDGKTSWHDEYKDSAWIFVGGLPYDLTEGDVVTIFSQYGEIVNINLVRDKVTGKTKGFAFICYEDQRSTILAVDNLNAIKILNRTIRVDHVKDYKPPKDSEKIDDETRKLYAEGCAPQLESRNNRPRDRTPPPELKQIKLERPGFDDKPPLQQDRTKIKREKFSDSDNDNERARAKKSDSSSSSSSDSDSDSDEPRRKRSKKSKKSKRSKSKKSKKKKNKYSK